MGSTLAMVSKEVLKKIVLNIVLKNKNDDDNIIKVVSITFCILITLVVSMFTYICLSPLSILSTFFLGVDFDDVLSIKSEAGFMQEQDEKFLANIQKEYYYTDSDGHDNYYYTDEYSDVFIENLGNCVYFNQADGRWANHPYAGTTSYFAACGPTAMAMVVSTLSGKIVSPPEMMDIASSSGYACNGAGSYHSIVPGLSKQFGLKCTGINSDSIKLKKALENGNLVVALMGPGDFTKNGHFIVLRGITSDGKVLVNDPSSNTRTGKSWDFDKFPSQSIKWASSGGPFWVITR